MKQNEKGFSLIESLITASVFLIVLAGVYLMVFHYAEVSRTEQSRRRMQQESRFLTSHFASELKNAGAVLTYISSISFSGATSYFNGISPLNSDNYANYPDGIIIAAGDPEAVTTLNGDYTTGDETMNVESTEVAVYNESDPNENPPWGTGDKGIILDPNRYYVFYVEDADPGILSIRAESVYYSGLLQTTNYEDAPQMGKGFTYPDKAPVIRLANFSIYLFREIPHNRKKSQMIRQLVRVTDAKDNADVLSASSPAEVSIISENIWDMQITYTAYPTFDDTITPDTAIDPDHHYFAGPSSSTVFGDLMTDIRIKYLKKLNIFIVSLSDEFSGKGTVKHRVPALGDQNWYYLPSGKYAFKILSLEIEPRNYNIAY